MNASGNRRSDPERFDLYTRGSLYILSGSELLLTVAAVGEISVETPAWYLVAGMVFGIVHTVGCILLLRAGIRHVIDRGPRPDRLRVAVGVLTLVGGAQVALWPERFPVGDADGPGLGFYVLLALAGFYVAALTAGMSPRSGVVVGGAILAATLGAVVSAAPTQGPVVGGGLAWTMAVGAMAASYRTSVWMLDVVWELDRSRQAQARLAVAEERLRFARDLHDVLGRNLSVVAVKSELAAQLARRGKDDAVDQMLEVRQIAEDSLREVRDVVRGYRTGDLDAELAGSRAVLEAAGVACQVVGDAAGLREEVQAALGWVVREGTTNVLRHSDAATCTFRLQRDDGAVTLTMENDGVRARPPGDSRGSGLVGLRERLEALGGTLQARARAGDRYLLEASLPLTAGSSA